MFISVTGNMSSSFDNFVRTVKLGFRDFARSVIQDLIAIQLKMQAMSLFRMAFSAFTGGGVGGVRGPDNIDVGGGWNPASAGGGPVEGGKIGLVGENGPELFIPDRSGTIVPNNQLASVLGNSGPQVVYNGPYIASMNAIDTQSAAQFLAKNKDSVWAANQSASRSMPQGR